MGRIYDKQEIRDLADPEVVADALGLETKRMGSRISILCPRHDDRHFGSCYLTKKGFKCYACNESGDVFDLVMAVLNTDFPAAREFLGDMLGLTPLNEEESKPKKQWKRVLSDEVLQMIGLTPQQEGKGIARSVRIVDEDFPQDELEPGQYLEWHPVLVQNESEKHNINNEPDPTPNGYCVVMESVDRHPLQTLLNTDEAAYRQLIRDKAGEAMVRYGEMAKMAINPASFYHEDNVQSFLEAHYCSLIAESIGLMNFIGTMKELQRRCQDLVIEYGDVRPQTTEKKKRRNTFGKIREKGTF